MAKRNKNNFIGYEKFVRELDELDKLEKDVKIDTKNFDFEILVMFYFTTQTMLIISKFTFAPAMPYLLTLLPTIVFISMFLLTFLILMMIVNK